MNIYFNENADFVKVYLHKLSYAKWKRVVRKTRKMKL